MQEEQKIQVIGTRLTNEVIEKIKSTIGDDSMADFIRKAIENELHGSHNSAKEFSGMTLKTIIVDDDTDYLNLLSEQLKNINYSMFNSSEDVIKNIDPINIKINNLLYTLYTVPMLLPPCCIKVF